MPLLLSCLCSSRAISARNLLMLQVYVTMLVLDRAFVLGETGLRRLTQPEKGMIDHDMRSELKGTELEYRGVVILVEA